MPGKRRHPARPEQALGAGADAAPLDVDDDVLVAGGRQIEPAEHELLRCLRTTAMVSIPHLTTLKLPEAEVGHPLCQANLTIRLSSSL